MSLRSNRHEVSIDVRVNGRQFRSVEICPGNEAPEDFDALINDSQCGLLNLHEHFVLELRSGCTWKSATLADLRNALLQSDQFPRPPEMQTTSEMAELRLFSNTSVDPHNLPPRARRIEQFIGYERCVRRVRAVLRDAAISCIPFGAVFIVVDRERARTVLLRAGFQPSGIAGALLEPFSGCAVYLIECPVVRSGSEGHASEHRGFHQHMLNMFVALMYEPVRAVVQQEAVGDRRSAADLTVLSSLIHQAQMVVLS